MKKNTLVAVAGLVFGGAACIANAGVTLSFVADTSELDIGDTAKWTVYASFTGFADPSAYFGGFVGSFDAMASGAYTTSNFQSLMNGQGTPAQDAMGSVVDVNIFNSALLGTDDPANPIAIFSFDATLLPGGAFQTMGFGATGVATVFASDFVFESPTEYTDFEVVSNVVRLIPAPGAGVLMLGGLAIGRRRR